MTTIVTRAGKGLPLTNNEMDSNLINLNNDKIETSEIGVSVQPFDAETTKNSEIQTLENKTLIDPEISTIVNTGTLTLPTSTDTLVGRATADTLTNKTILAAANTVEASSGPDSSPLSYRNKIINGNFDFWQRGTSLSNNATGGLSIRYLADRFRLVASQNTAMSHSRQAFVLGQTDVPGEPSFFHRSVVTPGAANAANRAFVDQLIEDVRTLAGSAATFTFWAKADANRNIAIDIVQGFGSGGSPSSEVNGILATKVALTTVWQKISLTVAIPSLSGKTLGTDGNSSVGVRFWLSAGSNFNSQTDTLGEQSGTFDIAQVQLEAGSVATPFERRPIGLELALCRRYYNPGTTANWFFSNVTSGSGYQTRMLFSVPMRASPTVVLTNASNSNFPATTGLIGTTIEGFTENRVANGTGPGNFISNWTADAEL